MKYIFWQILIFLFGCQEKQPTEPVKNEILLQEKKTFQAGNIFASNQFAGAHLNDFLKINDSIFQAIISPENIPVNHSPWFAFQVWSKEQTEIQLEIKYTHHRHRFIPKTSFDGKNWEALDTLSLKIDTTNQKVTIPLQLNPMPLWISAQEVISSDSTYRWMEDLAQLTFVDKKEIGKTALGQPIFSLKVNAEKRDQTLLIIGRQHPPEVPGGTIALEAFIEELLSMSDFSNYFLANFEILIVPLLNPDGADLGHWRHNANGVDLNRDWQLFSQPETQAVRSWLKKKGQEKKRDFFFGMDFHTSYSGPYLLVLASLNEANSGKIISTWIEKIETMLPDYQVDKRPRSQDLPYCYNWMINELNMEAVTFEEGDEKDRSEIKIRAQVYAKTLMKTLLEKFVEE
jgi:hypothetical protein